MENAEPIEQPDMFEAETVPVRESAKIVPLFPDQEDDFRCPECDNDDPGCPRCHGRNVNK